MPQDLELLEEHPWGVGCTHSGQIFNILRNRTVSATNPSGFTHSQLWCTTHSWQSLSFAHIYETESAFGLYFHPIYSPAFPFLSPLPHCLLHKELDVSIYDQWNYIFFWDNTEVYQVFPSVSVTIEDFIEKKTKAVWYIHMNLERTGFLLNTMSSSGSKLCHQTPSVSFYSRSTPYLNVIKIKNNNKFFSKAYPIQAIMPQDHLTENCSVTLMHPSYPDPRKWQAKQHQDKPVHFIFSDPLPCTISLLLQLPLTKDQFWQNSHYTSAIQLHWFCFCFALLLNCLIKLQMPLLILDGQGKNTLS